MLPVSDDKLLASTSCTNVSQPVIPYLLSVTRKTFLEKGQIYVENVVFRGLTRYIFAKDSNLLCLISNAEIAKRTYSTFPKCISSKPPINLHCSFDMGIAANLSIVKHSSEINGIEISSVFSSDLQLRIIIMFLDRKQLQTDRTTPFFVWIKINVIQQTAISTTIDIFMFCEMSLGRG